MNVYANRNRLTDTKNKFVVTEGKREGERNQAYSPIGSHSFPCYTNSHYKIFHSTDRIAPISCRDHFSVGKGKTLSQSSPNLAFVKTLFKYRLLKINSDVISLFYNSSFSDTWLIINQPHQKINREVSRHQEISFSPLLPKTQPNQPVDKYCSPCF